VGKRKQRGGTSGFIGAGAGEGLKRGGEGAAPGMSDVSRGEGSSDVTLARCSRGVGETDRWARPLHSAVSLIIQIFFKRI
jgi:hypothetical protein